MLATLPGHVSHAYIPRWRFCSLFDRTIDDKNNRRDTITSNFDLVVVLHGSKQEDAIDHAIYLTSVTIRKHGVAKRPRLADYFIPEGLREGRANSKCGEAIV